MRQLNLANINLCWTFPVCVALVRSIIVLKGKGDERLKTYWFYKEFNLAMSIKILTTFRYLNIGNKFSKYQILQISLWLTNKTEKWYVKGYPTMHHFKIPRCLASLIAYKFMTEGF